ncbi:Zinc finger ZIC 4 [Fusarium albosuccineum]|uniref:Zinc finger ZIC 4 n=1 Tax=Fusarium albosuccineum TaxID=1237068 RepID=A0A8H4L031_9HYPO|nr:Zinc finger ZIC 4 [Fusarium albosuccineum]
MGTEAATDRHKSTTPNTTSPRHRQSSPNMSTYNQISELPADQYRHPDADSRYHTWPGSSSSSSSSYYHHHQQEPSPSDPRYHAYSNLYSSQSGSSSASHHAYRLGEYGEAQQAEDHYNMWPSQEYAGPASSSSVATSSSPIPQDDSFTWGAAENSDQNMCQCGKAFRRPSDLAKHQKYHIKYFACLFSGCDKAFATQKDLTRHMRTHRKGEGYQCKVEGCRKAMSGHVYSRKDNFDRHMRTAHPEHPHI